jgi:hypothetical protein
MLGRPRNGAGQAGEVLGLAVEGLERQPSDPPELISTRTGTGDIGECLAAAGGYVSCLGVGGRIAWGGTSLDALGLALAGT